MNVTTTSMKQKARISLEIVNKTGRGIRTHISHHEWQAPYH